MEERLRVAYPTGKISDCVCQLDGLAPAPCAAAHVALPRGWRQLLPALAAGAQAHDPAHVFNNITDRHPEHQGGQWMFFLLEFPRFDFLVS